jgi:hypothetical protein
MSNPMRLTLPLLILLLSCTHKPVPDTIEEETPEWLRESNGKPPNPVSEAESRDYRACSRDDECVYVLNGCCDCANGGDNFAVRADKRDSFLTRFAECKKFPCTEMGAMEPCGSGHVSCKQGLCSYAAKGE